MPSSSAPCEFLAWDTDFFGFRIARVTEPRLDPRLVNSIMEWCRAERVECLYFLADSAHAETTRLAEDNGFRLVDIRVTLQHDLSGGFGSDERESSVRVRDARAADVPALQAIARTSYRDTRYYADPCFPDELCDALYATWIKRSCEGYADQVFVTTVENDPIGYISCHLSEDRMRGKIGLVGVASGQQGRGVGRILVNRALRWFAEQPVEVVEVVTQGRNIAAQRLYQRCGFLTSNVQLWYHRWFTGCR